MGKMLEASGELVYVNEPLNPSHPPGRSPGVLDAEVQYRFQYINESNDAAWLPAFEKTASLRYGLGVELRRNRGAYDLARCAKYATAFTVGRVRGRRALFDDPFAVLSTAWFARRLGCTCVVLVRDPVAVVGSWRRLGWSVHFHELLEQRELIDDHLHGYVDRMRSLVGSTDWLARSCLLWEMTYAVALAVGDDVPNVHIAHYERLATEPESAFRQMYRTTGLTWSDSVATTLRRATTATSDGRGGPHAWTLRGGPSRTAFQALDSRSAVETARSRLDARDAARVRDLTREIAAPLGYHI